MGFSYMRRAYLSCTTYPIEFTLRAHYLIIKPGFSSNAASFFVFRQFSPLGLVWRAAWAFFPDSPNFIIKLLHG
jgi:hypothetical protein